MTPTAPFVKPSVMPGFRLTILFTLFYLTLIVLLPLGALLYRASSLGVHDIVALALDQRTLAAWIREAGWIDVAYRNLSFGIVALEAWRGGAPLVMTTRASIRFVMPISGLVTISCMNDCPIDLNTFVMLRLKLCVRVSMAVSAVLICCWAFCHTLPLPSSNMGEKEGLSFWFCCSFLLPIFVRCSW